jgi:hypothetical protein
MLIENNIEDGIDFFHMDALSSAVALQVKRSIPEQIEPGLFSFSPFSLEPALSCFILSGRY